MPKKKIDSKTVYEAVHASGHYLVKMDWEVFRLINGRLDLAPDYDALAKKLKEG